MGRPVALCFSWKESNTGNQRQSYEHSVGICDHIYRRAYDLLRGALAAGGLTRHLIMAGIGGGGNEAIVPGLLKVITTTSIPCGR